MGIYNPNIGKLYSKLEQVGRGLFGETQHGTGSANFLNPKNWKGTTGKALDSVGDAYNGLRSGVLGVMGAAGAAGKLRALAPLGGAGLRAAAPVITGLQLKDAVRDVATTSTDDYNKRLEAVPGFTPGNNIDKGSMFDRATNALGMREDAGGYMDKAWRGLVNTTGETLGAGKIIPDDVGLRQYGRDVLTRTAGALSDIGANATDAVTFGLGPDLRKNFADVQEKQAAADRLRAATKPKPPAAPTPATPTPAAPEVDQKAAAAALDQKMVAESPNGYVEMPPQKGLRSNTYTNVPSQIDNFANSKGTVSTIEGPGVEGWKRMLDNMRSLREPETPIQDRIHVVSNPGWAKLGGYSVQDRAMQAIDALPRDMSPGNKADAIAHLLNTANTADSVAANANANADRRQKIGTSDTQNNNPSLRDLLAVEDFRHKLSREQVEDQKWEENNALQQKSVGASMATAQNNIDASKENMIDKQFARYFQKRDAKGNFVPDGDNIKEFSTQLGQAMATLANTNDPKDRQRFAVPYKGVDGIKWRARQWNELDDATKGHLVQMYNFSKRVQALNKGGVGGGNFGMYRNPSRDSQGRAVFKDGDKVRAIVDVDRLNSNDNSWFPFFGGVDESFGPRKPKDIGGPFGAGVQP